MFPFYSKEVNDLAKNIYLLNFKNYNNREIEVPGNHAEDYTRIYGNINVINNMTLWNPNDGINTVINTCWFVSTVPNYVLVTPTDGDEIESRWWVIKHERIAGTQYRLYLYRDLIADNIDLVLNNQYSFIKRGYCDEDNNLIYNEEEFVSNEIKAWQYPLTDFTRCPWVCIYLGAQTYETTDSVTITITKDTDGNILDTSQTQSTSTNLYNNSAFYPFDFEDVAGAGVNDHFFIDYRPIGQATSSKWTTQKYTVTGLESGSAYCIVAIPYAYCTYVCNNSKSTEKASTTPSDALNIAQACKIAYGSKVLDVQILPFCPCPKAVSNVTKDDSGDIHLTITDTNCKNGYMIGYRNQSISGDPTENTYTICLPVCGTNSQSDISLYHEVSGQTYNVIASISVGNIKESLCTTKYRLSAPNGSASWDFNPEFAIYKSNRNCILKADFTYMPYQPYINIKPLMRRMYGDNYKDYRGLICGGDYSLPQITSAWTEYVNNNRNYAASFSRQIESLRLNHSMEKRQELLNITTNGISNTASGAVTGSMVGGGIAGGIAGAAIGGIASVASSVMSMIDNETLRQDEMDAAIRQQIYTANSIKASPTTISNITAFNIDNTFFPLLEIYQSTIEDTNRYQQYIENYGYNISTFGKLADYTYSNMLWHYELSLNRLDGFVGDSEELQQLVTECNKGFYYKYYGGTQ